MRLRLKNTPILTLAAVLGILAGCSSSGGGGDDDEGQEIVITFSRSGPVQLSTDEQRLFVVNKLASPDVGVGRGSLTIVRVKNQDGDDVHEVLAEIAVGVDPFAVSLDEKGTRAFVTNGADNTVSVIDLGEEGKGPYQFVTDIVVGSEPRGSVTSGARLFIANYGDGTIAVLNTETLLFDDLLTLELDGQTIDNPFGLLALANGDVWVTDFFAHAASAKGVDEVEGFDDGKDARVALIQDLAIREIVPFSPLEDSGFTADRTAFDPDNGAVNDTYKAPDGVDPTAVPQGVYFNQLSGFAYDEAGGYVYLPAIGAQPAPPVRFNVNVQSLVGVLNPDSRQERSDLHININQRIAANFEDEPPPPVPFTDPETRLDRAFFADIVAMDIASSVAVMISRAGSYLIAGDVLRDGSIQLIRDDRGAIQRLPTTNIPHGVVLSRDGSRAYVSSELVGEVTILNMAQGALVEQFSTAETSENEVERRELLGKLSFFTGMGLPADVDPGTDPRDIDTHRFREMASSGNWSSCASCHPGGAADGVTWIFPTGPRQTISLEGFFSLGSTTESLFATTDQKVSNWNSVRGSITDFNNNARNVQGGFGFTPLAEAAIDNGGENGDVEDAGLVFNHGPRLGVSNALDFMTEWVASLRVLNRPSDLDVVDVARGRTVFENNCASCHGGSKWTRSDRILDLVRWPDPAFGDGAPLSKNLENPAATVIAGFDSDDDTIFETRLVENTVAAETLDLTDPIEIRGLGALIGQGSAGLAASFVPPSLFNVRNTPPYGHHGRAQSLEDVFEARAEGGLGHPAFDLTEAELREVLEFIRAIDSTQPIVP